MSHDGFHALITDAQHDPELTPWLLGILNDSPVEAGDFLKSLAAAAVRASPENYRILRPALLHMRDKYPKYHAENL